jgi:hypothetical protein
MILLTAALILHLADDREQAIDKTVEACFRVELKTECRPVPVSGTVRPPAGFYSLRIEGESHGPVDLRREALPARPDGSLRVTVPRKARLRIESGERRQPITISLYKPEDPAFREPFFRARLEPGTQEVNVPAGELIASLTLANNAGPPTPFSATRGEDPDDLSPTPGVVAPRALQGGGHPPAGGRD